MNKKMNIVAGVAAALMILAAEGWSQTLISTGTRSGIRLQDRTGGNDFWLDPVGNELRIRFNGVHVASITSAGHFYGVRFYGDGSSLTGGGGGSNWTVNGANIYRASNVGIGSTGPAAKLHVSSGTLLLDGTNAKLLVPDGAAATPSIAFAGATNTGIYRDPGNILVFVANGSARMHTGGATPEVFLYSKLLFQDSANDIGEASQYQPRHVRFQGDLQATKASADTASSLFIGRKNRGTLSSPSALTSGDDLLALSGQGYVGATGGYVESAKILFDSEGTVTNAANGLGGAIKLQTRASGGSLTDRLMVDSAGSVGIGVTSPQEALHINPATTGTTLRIGNYTGLGEAFSSGATVLTDNLTLSKSADQMLVMTTHASYGARALRLGSSEGLSFHAVTGAVTAGDAVSNQMFQVTNGGVVNLRVDGTNTGELKVGYTATAPAGYYSTYAP